MSSVKIKKIKQAVRDPGLADLFNQMLGAGAVNMNICYPKYDSMRDLTRKLLDVLEAFNDSTFFKSIKSQSTAFADNKLFIEKSRVEWKEMFATDLSKHQQQFNLNLVEDEIKEKFGKEYEMMKKSELVMAFIKTCENLVRYKKHLNNEGKLDHKFILNMAGAEFCPFPFSNTNFKTIMDEIYGGADIVGNAGMKEVKFVMLVLHKLLILSFDLYQTFSKPDIDVNEFVKVIMENIDQVQKHIPRCEKAFAKIKESVGLLQGNFNNYYKDFLESQDQMIIMQNFVADVAKDTHADPETTRQFRKIIAHYKEIAQHQIKNPKVKMLFEKVNENFKELEKHENLVGVKNLDEEDEPEPEDPEEVAKREQEEAEKARIEEEKKAEMEKKKAEYFSKSVDQIMQENGLGDEVAKPRKGKKGSK